MSVVLISSANNYFINKALSIISCRGCTKAVPGRNFLAKAVFRSHCSTVAVIFIHSHCGMWCKVLAAVQSRLFCGGSGPSTVCGERQGHGFSREIYLAVRSLWTCRCPCTWGAQCPRRPS
eukprot:jgi/Botrbrau1/19226/Bobra.0077s0125.1